MTARRAHPRADTGSVLLVPDTTVIFDEAGMVDHTRLDALIEPDRAVRREARRGWRRQAAAVDRSWRHVRPAHRATRRRRRWEIEPAHNRSGRAAVRGKHYARGNPSVRWPTTRLGDDSTSPTPANRPAESAVQAWAQLTKEVGIDKVALIADASNREIDRLNARAQHLRAQRGELGDRRTPAVKRPLRATARRSGRVHRPTPPTKAAARRERHARPGQRTSTRRGRLTLALDGSDRRLQLAGEEAESLRLAYAQHVYRQQGATVERAVVLTAAGKQAGRPPTFKPPEPAKAPTGISPATNSAKKDKTPTGSHARPDG